MRAYYAIDDRACVLAYHGAAAVRSTYQNVLKLTS